MADDSAAQDDVELCRQLLDVTQAAERAAVEDDLEEFDRLLERRGELVARIGLSGFRRGNSEVASLAAELLQSDERLIQTVQTQLEALERAVHDVRRGRQAVRGYRPGQLSRPAYYDRTA